jgi:hypothetical protein
MTVPFRLNPFTAKVAIMRLLGSAPKSHLCDQRRRSKVTGLSDLMTLFIDLGCLYCKQTQIAFNVFKNTLNWLKIDSVDQKFNWLECGNFSQDAGTPGTETVIAFLQLAVKGLNSFQLTIFPGWRNLKFRGMRPGDGGIEINVYLVALNSFQLTIFPGFRKLQFLVMW